MTREEIEKQLSQCSSNSREFSLVDLIARKCILDLQESYHYVIEFTDQGTREALEHQVSKAVRAALREYRNVINNL